jgi:lysophospholipase L1-like esterase
MAFQHRIVALGDSITRGYPTGATLGSKQSYPAKLNTLLGPHAWILNAGIGSEKTDDMLARIAVVTTQYASEVIILAGLNDLNAGRNDATIIAGLTSLYQAVEAAGGQVIALTITPYGNSGFWTPTAEGFRVSVNNWIKNTSGRRYVDLDPPMGNFTFYGPSRPMLKLPYQFDPIHPNGTGFDVMADAIFKDPRGYAQKRDSHFRVTDTLSKDR